VKNCEQQARQEFEQMLNAKVQMKLHQWKQHPEAGRDDRVS
jgi:hypothetical protein